jgi:CHAD domain-containing protein
MATRDSMSELIQQCEDAIRYAQDEFKESSLQEHYNDDDYTTALQRLEQTYQDIAKMAHSANSQQRDQLHRMRLQIQQLQNTMILQGGHTAGGRGEYS